MDDLYFAILQSVKRLHIAWRSRALLKETSARGHDIIALPRIMKIVL